jgi:signal transduction histidine kinase
VVRDRHKSPVLAALLTASTVVTVALVSFGLKNLEQQGAVERQRAREQLDNRAEAIAAGIRGKLAEAGERLSRWVSNSSSPAPAVEGAVVVAAGEGRTEVVPRGAIPFIPGEAPVQTQDRVFADAEAIELAGNQLAKAAEQYRKLAQSADPRIRAEALLRLGRTMRKAGNLEAALVAYQALARFAHLTVSGLPAELVSLDGQRLTQSAAGDHAAEQRIGEQIAHSLDKGRWLLSRGPAEFYRDVSAREPQPGCWLLAEALTSLWETELKGHASASGLRVVGAQSEPVLVVWRSNGPRSAALASFTAGFIAPNVGPGYAYELTDAAGQRIAGAAATPRQTVARVIGDPQHPWMMRIWADGTAHDSENRLGSQFLLAMLVVVVLFLWGTVYFMARAIRRESRVARLQSDFVAAVSHEFRTPLTTVRQLSEMLEMDQVPSEERKQKYYSVLVGEARRLQRLVETLLNFGKMEAGAQQYHFEKLDVRELVGRAVREASSEEMSARIRITSTADPEVAVLGDADALTLALRNLVDNGLKYSPANECVEVSWSHEDGRVSISVTDHGPGIPKEEQEVVFQKFVRGQSAIQASIKGTGVGLAMVRHILTAHGGKIRLESEPGRGATFTIELAEAR